ncbi:MAG: lysylphosphatidylglycerol synthase transmembrane domain-containing protein [Tenuifilaceae bacterium]|nr:lysylphosphatidylglycerol synthase transmembrane domain-containing protein [Bacteroidales bacterium]MDI9515623.1 lysylphosphatidylglycerol synthase transmembrane domain-containing protein [Bacteroidota bacterium]NLH57427.1 flippase-like domain-containing protein [Rikenellaceae bacterium]HNV81336.1 lysylphosphatidylglycerol synthase transmembrane domain-containing protein [Tenuifilaceae bacterium]MZP82105.1 flippase-like domain-containing protein [Bacteroidales bacterium]
MKPSLKKNIQLVLFLFLAALLLFFAFRGVNFKSIAEGFREANYLWVFVALLAGIASHIVRALRWRLLMEPIGHKPPLLNTLGALMVGYLTNIAFPRMGELARCGSLKKTDRVPFEPLFGTVIVERAVDLIALLVLLAVVFLIRIEFFGSFLWNEAILPIGQRINSIFVNSPLIPVMVIVAILMLIILIRRNVFGHKLNNRITSIFWAVIDGLKSIYTMKKRRAFLGYTFLMWFLYWLMTWLMVFSTAPTSQLGPIDGFFLLVVGSMGMAAPVQGGFGAFHIITAMGLGIYGIERAQGLVYAIISHESQTLLVIVMALAYLVFLFFKRSPRKTEAV